MAGVCVCVSVCMWASLICCVDDMDSLKSQVMDIQFMHWFINTWPALTNSNQIVSKRFIPIHLDFMNAFDRVYQHDPISSV